MLPNNKKAVLLGETKVCIQCAAYLLARDWKIAYIVSEDDEVINWAKQHAIPILSLSKMNEATVGRFYLFSIINPYIIPEAILVNKNMVLALNYHDSPLPKYAGIYSTTWAIINAEKSHGVTLHKIKPGIDDGEIVAQVAIPIDSDETALSLNLKCSAQLLSIFQEVINKIETATVVASKQDFSKRTYYGLKELPRNYAIINGITEMVELDRLVRGLSFGAGYENPVACVKAVLNGKIYLAEDFKVSGITAADDANNPMLFNKVRDSHGNETDLKIRFQDLGAYTLTDADIQYLAKIKVLERKHKKQILKFFRTNAEASLKILDHDLTGDPEQIYTKELTLPSPIHNNTVLALVCLVLVRFTRADFIMSLYVADAQIPPGLRNLVERRSFIYAGQKLLQASLANLEDYLLQSQTDSYILTKDFAYRYQLQVLTDIAVVIGEVVDLDQHKLVIRINPNNLEVRGPRCYQSLIDNIIEALATIFSKDILDEIATKDLRYVNLLSQEQYHQVVFEHNRTERAYPRNRTIHGLFEEQVLRTPNNLAIVYEDIKLTYDALNRKANQLANYLLQSYEIKPDELVVLCLDRNEAMIIAMLAVLKAGGAYVPIDPSYPDERIKYTLEDTNSKVVITNSGHQNRFSLKPKVPAVLEIDSKEIGANLATQQDSNPKTLTTSTNLVYVIYTSGTTGKPKGVMIEHRGVVNCITYLIDYNKLNSKTIGSQYANIGFDALVIEIYPILLSGGSLCIMPEQDKLSPIKINEAFCKNNVTYAFLPTKFAELFFNLKNSSLTVLIVAGEKLEKFVKQLYRIDNGYGPTENTVYTTNFVIDKQYKNIPIGKPIDNINCYVVDNYMNLVPTGIVGELMIGGEGLARGYLNRPDLTSEKFISNPFQTAEEKSQNKNSRLYKTGDLVRMLADGNLEFIGRNDDQVKINGFRIELGEIESKILSYPEIKQVVVMAKEKAGKKYLVGYYAAKDKLDSAKLQDYLLGQLPSYMVPNIFVQLEVLPLTKNGKLNRQALPEPVMTETTTHIAPRTELEQRICEIYAQVLHFPLQQVGITDDFFKMGGDSISSIQLVARIRQNLGLTLSIKDIFTYRNIAQLMAHVLTKQSTPKASIKIKHEDHPLGRIDLLPIQTWFFANVKSGLFAKYQHWNQSFMIKTPELAITTLKLSIKKLLEYHDAFRLRYKNFEQHYREIDFDKEVTKLKIIDVSKLTSNELEGTLTAIQSNFNIEHGPIYVIAYLHGYQDKTARLFFALHHLIVDRVSWQIITNDLAKLYQLLQDRNNIANTSQELLGAKGTSYGQWTKELKAYQPSLMEINYWNDVLTDYRFIQKHRAKTIDEEFSLTPQVTKKLLTQTNETYHTEINDILLAALARTLAQTFGTPINYMTLEGHGREEINGELDITKTLGWFTVMYPVKLIDCPEIAELIKTTKENLRAIPTKGIGYGAIKGYNNLPPISFNYLGQISNAAELWTIVASKISVDPQNQSSNSLDIYGYVLNQTLKFQISSSLPVTEVTNNFKANLEELIEHCSNSSRSYLTLSDIDRIINQGYLDKVQQDVEVAAIYLANNLQQGFIYHAIRQGAIDDAYISQFIWEYQRSIAKDKFEEAWQLVQKQYPSLRLRFAWDQELIQIIDKEQKLDFRYIAEGSEDVAEIIKHDRQELYDLHKGNLLRVYLIKSSKAHYSCICSMHHIILDGWSTPLLINRVHEIYEQLLKNNYPAIAEDIVYQEAQVYLQEHQHENQEYWQEYIKQIEARVDLKYLLKPEVSNIEIKDHLRVEQEREEHLEISGPKLAQLKDVCQRNAITVNAVIQYAWHKILHIYGTSNTTVVGTVVAGRELPINNIESSIGLFLNTLPLIFRHDHQGDIIAQLKLVQNSINEINSKSNINLASLQTGGARLFDSLIAYENYPSPKSSSTLSFSEVKANIKIDYPLTIVAYEKAQAIELILYYAGELFAQATMKQLLDKLLFFIAQIIAEPARKKISYLNQEEYQRLVIDYNNTERAYPRAKTIHSLFEEQVLRTPNNLAIVYEDIKLTYDALNRKANQLANYLLQNYTISADELIALCVDRSEYMLITMLGVLKAGGAYVPIDPNYPSERISYILKDSETRIILTNEVHKNKIQQLTRLQEKNPAVIGIDSKETQIKLMKQLTTNPITATNSSNLIYVIYTSGTTGNPKGVMIEHRGITSLVKNVDYITVGTNDSFIQFSDPGFDAATFEIWTPLLNGAKLIIPADKMDIFGDIELFYKTLTKNKITVLWLTKTLFDQMLVLDENVFKDIKYLLVGGEALNKQLISRLINSNYRPQNVINGYGPTENSVFSSTLNITKENIKATNTVPIGTPLTNRKAYILDKNLNPLPIGAIGELYVAGDGLAKGYLNQPELTAEKFIFNPFQTAEEKSQNKNSRLYKTGDLVRMLADGNIEYIGRNDFQVKIRGYRIELGEIEKKLMAYPDIKQAVVLVREHMVEQSIDKQLIAYYVAANKVDEQELKKYLLEHLPNYMLPTAFIAIQKLPLTANGKLDSKALLALEVEIKDNYVAPRNMQEQIICEVFSKILDLKKIGITADFFALGGNSISAIRLGSRLQENFDIKLADIFELRTPEMIAKNSKFGKNFLQHKLTQVKQAYRAGPHHDRTVKAKIQIEKNTYLQAVKKMHLDVSLAKPMTQVLLTGATGYLGCNLLNQLLELTNYKIYLPIRANSQAAAIERINKKYQFYFDRTLNEVIAKRVLVFQADIEQEFLGLSSSAYHALTTKIDSVLHAAALVKHYGKYDKFYSANVGATIKLLEFAKLTKAKDFHYISTIGVLQLASMLNDKKHIYTEDDIPQNTELHNVYAQTKLQAEHQVVNYRTQGITCNIYRVGNLAFISKNYRAQENLDDNAFYNWLKCLFAINCCAEEITNAVEISQVDLTAQAIVKIFDKQFLRNQIYHVFNPYYFNMTNILRKAGIKILPIEMFINAIIEYTKGNNYNELIEKFILRQGWSDWWDRQGVRAEEIMYNRTQSVLEQLDFKWCPITTRNLLGYLDSLKLKS